MRKKRILKISREILNVMMKNGYELLDVSGEGGFGSVYRARQLSTGQLIAIKILNLENLSQEQQKKRIKRFKRETHICAKLNHPHIVKLLDKGILSKSCYYAVFEYIEGKTLKETLMVKSPLTTGETAQFMAQTLDALSCAHAQGIVHRDLKPQNIMITGTGARFHIKVLDFGIGTFIPEARKGDYKTITISRETLGTPSYSAPEQLRGEPPTIKSDLYAWGLVLLECLTGRPVITGRTLAEIYHKQLNPIEIPLPPAIAGHELAPLLRRILCKNPAQRAGDTKAIHNEFIRINLNTLVGDLNQTALFHGDAGMASTDTNISFWEGIQCEQRRITVLCCNMSVLATSDVQPDFEVLEALQRDQLNLCHDTAARYGGYAAGILGNSIMFYYGYPQTIGNDSRLAAETALDLAEQAQRRNSLLIPNQGLKLEFRIGIHTGMVLIKGDELPGGMTPDIALRLENLAGAGSITISENTCELLRNSMLISGAEKKFLKLNTCAIRTFQLIGKKKIINRAFLEKGNGIRLMVGREEEWKRIKQLLEKVKNGLSQSVLISGEAGIGKSRLAWEIYKKINREGFSSRDCRCLPEYMNNALHPVLEMLKVLLNLDLDKAENPAIAAENLDKALAERNCDRSLALPVLCYWLSLPLPESFSPLQHSPDRQKQILFEVLKKIIFTGKNKKPVAFFVEDLHWIDPSTLEFLDQIIANQSLPGFLLVMTARTEFKNPWKNVNTIELKNLSRPAVEIMIKMVAGDREFEKETMAKLLKRTDGIPLYIEELTRMLLDKNFLKEKEGLLLLDDNADFSTIPATLQNLLCARLNGLGSAKEILQIASAIGREVDHSLLLSTCRKTEDTIREELKKIIRTNLISEQLRINNKVYIFRHALIRDAAYESMPASVRKETHLRIACILEKGFADIVKENPSLVARHYSLAGTFEKAVHYESEAAEISLQRSLNDDTINHCLTVLSYLANIPEEKRPDRELHINVFLTQALMNKYGWADKRVKERVDRSLTILDQVKGRPETVPALWALATYHHVAGNRREVRVLCDELTQIAAGAEDPGLRVSAATMNGARYQADGDFKKSVEALETAVGLYDPLRDRNHAVTYGFDTRVWAESGVGVIYWFVGYSKKARTTCRKAVEWARTVKHIPSLAIALLYQGLVFYHERNKTGALKVTTELLDLTEKYGLPAFACYGTILHLWARGEEEKIRIILDNLKRLGCRMGLPLYTAMFASALAEKGEIEESIAMIDECLEHCVENDEHLHEAVLHKERALYEIKIHPATTPSIRASLEKAAELGRSQGVIRIEGEALGCLSRLYGVSERLEKRLNEILTMYPEITIPECNNHQRRFSGDNPPYGGKANPFLTGRNRLPRIMKTKRAYFRG